MCCVGVGGWIDKKLTNFFNIKGVQGCYGDEGLPSLTVFSPFSGTKSLIEVPVGCVLSVSPPLSGQG